MSRNIVRAVFCVGVALTAGVLTKSVVASDDGTTGEESTIQADCKFEKAKYKEYSRYEVDYNKQKKDWCFSEGPLTRKRRPHCPEGYMPHAKNGHDLCVKDADDSEPDAP